MVVGAFVIVSAVRCWFAPVQRTKRGKPLWSLYGIEDIAVSACFDPQRPVNADIAVTAVTDPQRPVTEVTRIEPVTSGTLDRTMVPSESRRDEQPAAARHRTVA